MDFAIVAGRLHGYYPVATRWLAAEYRPRLLLLLQLAIGAVLLVPFAAAPVPVMSVSVAGLLVVSALSSALGNFLLVLVNRVTPAGVVAPLIYSQLLSAVVIGFAVFDDWPDGLALTGLVVIAVAGISSVWFAGRGR